MRTTLSILLLVSLATIALPAGASSFSAISPMGWWETLVDELADWWFADRDELLAKTGADLDPNGVQVPPPYGEAGSTLGLDEPPLDGIGPEADPNG